MILKWQSSYTSNNFTNNLYTLHISDVFRRIFGELCKKVIQKDLGNFHEMMEKWQIMRGKVLGCERLPNCIVKTCKILFTLLIGHRQHNLGHARTGAGSRRSVTTHIKIFRPPAPSHAQIKSFLAEKIFLFSKSAMEELH